MFDVCELYQKIKPHGILKSHGVLFEENVMELLHLLKQSCLEHFNSPFITKLTSLG